MPQINPLTKDQLFEKKIAENTGSNYNVGDISDVVPVTKDQSLLKEIALNSAGQSEDITELEGKVTANAEAIEAMVNVNGCCNILPCEAISSTTDAVVFTVNSDGSVTAVGTPSGSYPMIRYTTNYLLKAGTYVVDSGVGSLSPLYVNVTDNANTYTIADTYNANGKTEFTLNSDTAIKVEIVGHASEALNNTVYPMLYDARLTPTGYVPYAMTNRELTEKTLKFVKISKSSFAWDSTNKCFYHTNPPSEVTMNKGFIVNPLNGMACMNAYYSTVSGYLFVAGWVPVSASSIDETYDFDCYILT